MIVGLTGRARSGKSTAGVFIERNYGIPAVAFADPLKKAAMSMFGISEHMAYGADGYDRERIVEPWGISVREMLQKLGTDCARQVFFDDFWVRRLDAEVESNEEYSDGFVVTDVRFDNEAKWIKDRGGVVLSLHRNSPEGVRAHKSEDGVSHEYIDKYIPNVSTIADLQRLVVEALNG